MSREIDPRNPTPEQMGIYITFLSRQLSNGKMIANYFSGMRKFLSDNALAKSYSIPIKQLLVAAIHAKPALPKLPGEVWNADKVLAYFLRSPPNCYLTKLQLAGKCIVLLMLASGRRKADLMALDVRPQFMQKTDNVFFFTMNKLSKGNSPFTPQNNFMQYIEFHKFKAAPQICPYTMIEDYFQMIRNNRKIKPTHSRFFVTTTDCQKPAHGETVRRWAIDTLKLAGINCTPHSIRSAHASMAVTHNENIDSIMERCGWRHSSTFYKHYLRPVASGEKPTNPAGVTIDTTTFFCPPKLMKPGVRVIPPPPEYVLQSDIFPCGTTDPTDVQHKPGPQMKSSLDKYARKTATEEEIIQMDSEEAAEQMQNNIEVTEALLQPDSPVQKVVEPTEVTAQVTMKSTPNSKAQPKKSPYLVITSESNPQKTRTIVLQQGKDHSTTTPVEKQKVTPPKKICTSSVSKLKPAVELKLSPQYLTLRSRKLIRKSFSKKTYPKKRELRSILPKASTIMPVVTIINDHTPSGEQHDNGKEQWHSNQMTETDSADYLPDIPSDTTSEKTPIVLSSGVHVPTLPAPVRKDHNPTVEFIQGYSPKTQNRITRTPLDFNPVQVPNPPNLDKDVKDLSDFVGLEITAVGHSKIGYLFPDITLDKVVLFGTNYNFTYPVSPNFHPSALCTHFVCLGVFPLKLGIIVPTDFPDIGSEECIAITINDIPFKAKVFDVNEIRKTLYDNFRK